MIRRRSGVVLFVVVIVIALVSLAAYSFSILMRSELHAARLHADQVQTQMMTESGLSYLNSWAESTRSQRESFGGIEVNELLFRNILVDGTSDPLRPGLFSIVRPPMVRSELAEIDEFALNNENAAELPMLTFGLVDESSKLHLETILAWDTEQPGAGRTALMSLPNMTESTADAILDWIDEDNEVREFGAESEYYTSLDPRREPANAIPRSLQELLQVRGVTVELLFGFDRNHNYTIEEFERPQLHQQQNDGQPQNELTSGEGDQSQSQESKDQPSDRQDATRIAPARPNDRQQDDPLVIPEPWCRFLTVTSAEHNHDFFGQPRINLNAPDLGSLHRSLQARFGSDIAKFVVAVRQSGLYKGSKSPNSQPLPSWKPNVPPSFELTSVGSLHNAKVALGDKDDPTIYQSPWAGTGETSDSVEFAEFCDSVTLVDLAVVSGRINIMSAPREVLMAIPELTTEHVDQILIARSQDPGRDPNSVQRPSPYWLVEEEIMSANTFEQLSPYLTMSGDVFRCQIVGYYTDNSPIHRIEVIVDGTDDTPRPVYYTDLTRLGRGFELRQLLSPIEATAGVPASNGSPARQTLPPR
ncbi:MAG: general secretion pathway protein GspK [Planctomycetales bacterium]|nr:general secretion pathway protein GspK [Planctomycetales bacterium]